MLTIYYDAPADLGIRRRRQSALPVIIFCFFLLYGWPAAADENIYSSATWLMEGKCTSQDQVYSWKITGQTSPKDWKIAPWRDEPITIRGVELTKIAGGPTMWWMAGNETVADVMMFLGPGEDHGRHDFPAGLGMPMPAKSTAKPSDYIDLHGACSSGRMARLFHGDEIVSIFYTVYYTIDSTAR